MNQKKLKYMDSLKYEDILGLKAGGINEINYNVKNLDITNVDTYLRYPMAFCRDKENYKDVDCDNIVISNVPRQRDLNTGCYWIVPNKSGGRGFGDLDVNNDLRYAADTRNNFDYEDNPTSIRPNRFYELNRNVQDPEHLVMKIPRGGYDTRHMNKC
jgi:hypothetical protein